MNNCTKILLTDVLCYGWAKFNALDIGYVYNIGIRVSSDQKLLTLMFETEVMWVFNCDLCYLEVWHHVTV